MSSSPFPAPPPPASSSSPWSDRPTTADEVLWDSIVRATASLLRDRSVYEVSFESVAAVLDVRPAEVHRLFPTWTHLLVTTVQDWHDRRVTAALPIAGSEGAAAFLRAIVEANLAEPALARALTATTSVAAAPGHPLAEALRHEWIGFHALVQRSLADDVAHGREPYTMEPARGAEQLIALYEGLQLQAMLRPGMNLLEAYDRAVSRLRSGWSTRYRPSAWNA